MCSGRPENQVHAGVCENGLRELANVEREGGLLEGFLHCAPAEGAQVTLVLGRAAIAELRCQLLEGGLARRYLLPVACRVSPEWGLRHFASLDEGAPGASFLLKVGILACQ